MILLSDNHVTIIQTGPPPSHVLHRHAAARLLGVSIRTLGRMEAGDDPPPFTRVGYTKIYDEAALLHWAEARDRV